MKFGEKLLELRKKNGLSQEQLGEKLDVTRQTISNWELGITSPNTEQLKELSIIFNISIDDLLDNDIRNIVVEKVSNTEKLAGLILNLIKLAVLIIVVTIVLIILSVIVVKINRSKEQSVKREEMISCNIYGEEHSLDIVYAELTGQPLALGGDPYFSDILDLGKYNDAHQIFNIINDYVKKNNGTCEIKEIEYNESSEN